MDGLSAAGSIVGVLAITGQLIQSTKALYEFWSSVKEVPSRLHWLREDTKCLQESLEYIQQRASRESDINNVHSNHHALQRCLVHIRNLEALVAPVQYRIGDGRRARVWKSIKGELHASKIELYRKNLEEAKTSLLLTQATVTLSVSGLSVYRLTADRVRESVQTVRSGIASLILGQETAQSVSAMENQRLHDQIARLEREIQRFAEASTLDIDKRLAHFVTTDLEKLIQPVLWKTVTEGMSTLSLTPQPQQRACGSSRIFEHDATIQYLPPSSTNVEGPWERTFGSRRRRPIFCKYFSTAFGFLSLRYDMIYRTSCANGSRNGDPSFEFRCIFVPRFLLRKAIVVINKWNPVPNISLTELNFQFHPIVDSKSEIFKACENGDIDAMKELFASKRASPHDINDKGEDLLMVSSHPVRSTRKTDCSTRELANPLVAMRHTDFFLKLAAKKKASVLSVRAIFADIAGYTN